jgi:hypothetical protein
VTDAVRCSAWARSAALDPIGTIGSYSGFLLVEAPLPWPRDVAEIPALAAVDPGPGVRLQALVPADPRPGTDSLAVISYERSPGDDFCGYRRLAGRSGGADGRPGPTSADRQSGPVMAGAPVTDVLVCTHGRRDVCCGALGTNLALDLASQPLPPDVRVRRTSHTGGHRFAPTFIVLPEGTAWAYGDSDLVHAVLERRVPFATVAGRYRGCAGLDGPDVQALERAVLTEVGWELLDRPRRGYATGEDAPGGGRVVRLETGADRWEAVVSPGRTLPVPDCLAPLTDARKTETERVVSGLRAV